MCFDYLKDDNNIVNSAFYIILLKEFIYIYEFCFYFSGATRKKRSTGQSGSTVDPMTASEVRDLLNFVSFNIQTKHGAALAHVEFLFPIEI